ncbi:hypothetical protein KKH3_33620 [Pectobacterium actinidiae]|nr:hypothetical protein KKH3_33620 [Pectobacterium actinidiae]
MTCGYDTVETYHALYQQPAGNDDETYNNNRSSVAGHSNIERL